MESDIALGYVQDDSKLTPHKNHREYSRLVYPRATTLPRIGAICCHHADVCSRWIGVTPQSCQLKSS